MKYAHNDNDDPWKPLAALTAKVVSKQKSEETAGADSDERGQKQGPNEEHVRQRIRAIEAFERRARGLHR